MYKPMEKVGIFPGLGVGTPKHKSYTIIISTLTFFSFAQQTIEKVNRLHPSLPWDSLGRGERSQCQTIVEIISIFSEVYYIFVPPRHSILDNVTRKSLVDSISLLRREELRRYIIS